MSRARQWGETASIVEEAVPHPRCYIGLLDRLQKKPGWWIPGLPPLFRRDGGGRETITTSQLSHLTEINQPTLNEKRALTAGGQGSHRSPEGKALGELR